MRHFDAVGQIVRELGAMPMSDETRLALSFLVKHAAAVEDLAAAYIEEIDNGVLAAWEEYRDEYGLNDEDLCDQELFDGEERAYRIAHILVDEKLVWPEGYPTGEEDNV